MNTVDALIATATQWSDPDYPVRRDAILRTLDADNRFTEAAIVFAVNQQMALLVEEDLLRWKRALTTEEVHSVGVLNPGNIPLVELQDFLAVALSGNNYLGTVSSKSPALFPAFLSDVLGRIGYLNADLVEYEDLLASSDCIIASGSDETMERVSAQAKQADISESGCWLRGHRYSVAVLGGSENEDALLRLAEDALLHEGMGCRSVALIFAPCGMSIDSVLDAFAVHRAMFPAHDKTTGTLKMQQALLKAVNIPHAYADDFQFLISRGKAEVQPPGHVRWVEYDNIGEVQVWSHKNRPDIQCIYANKALRKLNPDWLDLGSAQRPALDWCPGHRSHVDFLANKK